jgi:23S rRNA pseudouridine1911/1915/1917 synthase
MFEVFHVAPDAEKQSLAQALRAWLPDRSWSQIKRLIAQRRVQINGNLCTDEQRRLKLGDVVRVSEQPLAAPVTARDVRLVYVDQHLVVIDKPAGVTTLRHSAEQEWSDTRKQRQPTLDELVEESLALSEKRRAGETHVRAVHRLDRDTSGLMVFARTVPAETELIRQFKKHSVDRAYIAIAEGDVAEQTIDTFLIRNRGDGLRGSTSDPNAEDTERAITHVRPLEKLVGYTVVECRLETGRTHQIRIHLSERGHRLAGEKMYVRTLGGTIMPDASGASRQALHAAVLGFTHPATGERLQFVSPLPCDMAALLERLRNAKR